MKNIIIKCGNRVMFNPKMILLNDEYRFGLGLIRIINSPSADILSKESGPSNDDEDNISDYEIFGYYCSEERAGKAYEKLMSDIIEQGRAGDIIYCELHDEPKSYSAHAAAEEGEEVWCPK